MIGNLKKWFEYFNELGFQVLNAQDVAYGIFWINICIILYIFCLDQELEIETDWLKDGMHWETKPNKNSKREQKAEDISTGRKQARQPLFEKKKV